MWPRQASRYSPAASGRQAPICYGDAMAASVDDAVLTEVGAVLGVVVSGNPALRAAISREWHALQQPTRGIAEQVQGLVRAAEKARRRLKEAAIKLVDGEIDRAGYELVREQAEADLKAAEAELARGRDANSAPALPPLDDVLRAAGNWSAVLAGSDVPAMRDLLGMLIEAVLPVRRGVGRYRARIVWTPAGQALRRIVRDLARAA